MLKTGLERLLAVTVSFLVGCGASQVGRAVFRESEARADVPVGRYEYNCIRAVDGITGAANKLGRQGWELSAAAGYGWHVDFGKEETMVWCFKRPLGASPGRDDE